MKSVFRSPLFFLAALIAHSGLIHAQEPSWRAELEERPAQALVGTDVCLKLDLENTSGRDLWMAQPFGWTNRYCGLEITGPHGDSDASECISGCDRSAVEWLPTFRTKRPYLAKETVSLTNFLFIPRCPGTYTVIYSCNVPSEALNPERDIKTGKFETNDDVWQGSLQSNVVKVLVVEPEGIDQQAYEAFGHDPLGRSQRHGELLRRFPNSTYAAYVVRKKTHPGTRPPKIDNNLYTMARGIGSFAPTPLPCVDPVSPMCVDVGISPGGYEGARRAAAWLDLVLRHHPDIWFADELLYKRAYTAFFLGEKEACAAGLEGLAEHGRPYIASKAGELLAALKAEGMLEEKEE